MAAMLLFYILQKYCFYKSSTFLQHPSTPFQYPKQAALWLTPHHKIISPPHYIAQRKLKCTVLRVASDGILFI